MKVLNIAKTWAFVLFAVLTQNSTGFSFPEPNITARPLGNAAAYELKCAPSENPSPECVIWASPSAFNNIPVGGGGFSIDVYSDDHWVASSNVSWISILFPSGYGNDNVIIQVAENFSSARSATIVIGTDCGATTSIRVSQEACNLSATPGSQTVEGIPGSISFNVASNSSWTVSSNASWLTINSPAGGNGSGTFSVSHAFNNTGEKRVGSIKVTGCSTEITLFVVQECYVCLSVQEFAGYLCAPANMDVVSNSDWTVTENIPWLSISPTSGSNNGAITLTATGIDECLNRTGSLHFVATKNGYSVSKSVQVHQWSTCLTVTPTNQNVSSAAGLTSFNIDPNGFAWSASTSAPWISLNPAYGPPSGINPILNATYTANNSNSNRVGYIYISSCGATQVVTVTQEGQSEQCSNDFEPANNYLSSAPTLTVPSNKKSQIGAVSDVDHWKFTVGSIGNIIGLTLTNLPANYDLFVKNSNGQIIAGSTNPGTMSEYINVTLIPGTYFAFVQGVEGAYNSTQCYSLSLFLDAFMGSDDRDSKELTLMNRTSSDNLDFTMYPNPTSGLTQIELNNESSAVLQVLNQLGQEVYRATGSARFEWNVSGLPNGLYSIQVQTENRNVVKQLSVNH